jgi:hypothetical protein
VTAEEVARWTPATDTMELPAVYVGMPLADAPTQHIAFPWAQPDLRKPSRLPKFLRRRTGRRR